MLKNLLIVFIGGGIGATLRVLGYTYIPNHNFPYATFFVNILGSLLIGIIFGLNAKQIYISNEMKVFLATGICGGFTTFSAFSVDNMNLLQQGKYSMALLYIFSSISLALLATWLGFKLVNG